MSFVINFIITMAMVTFLPLELLASSSGGDGDPHSSRAFMSSYPLDLSSKVALQSSISELSTNLDDAYVKKIVRHRALKNKRYMGRVRRIYPKMFSAVEVEVLPKVLETFDFRNKAAIIQSVESAQEQGFSLENIYALLRNATHMKEKWRVRAARAVPGVFQVKFLYLSSTLPDKSFNQGHFSQFYFDNIVHLQGKAAKEKSLGQWTFNVSPTRDEDASVENITPTDRFNVSGHEFNCLFRTFGAINHFFREEGNVFLSRGEYIARIKTLLEKPELERTVEFTRLLEEGMQHDDLVRRYDIKTPEGYLDLYSNSDLMLPSGTTRYGVAPSGLAVALAYVSGVHLNVFTYDARQGPQLTTEYRHPNLPSVMPGNTLNVYLRDGHYQIITFPGQEDFHSMLEAYQKENYLRIFLQI